MLLTLLITNAPKSQQFFGTFGRNTGLLTYLSFAILFIAAATATNFSIKKPFLISFAFAAGFNAVYGLVQAVGKDPQKWSNPYAPVIGTLGNPNFVSAFLGMGIALAMAYLVASKTKVTYRILASVFIAVALFDILKSDAQQGLIISLLSGVIVGYFWLKSYFDNVILRYAYLALSVAGMLVGIAGTLQKGPLASILYKPSVTYRGDYWHAGLVMIKENFLFGVGLDSYGDWYRNTRTLAATIRRGPATVSNAAHNVFIDIAGTAGIVALIGYLLLIFLGIRAALRISKKMKKFDPFFVSIFAAWIGYLVQSIISINNIALGIWGWVLPGILISMEKWDLQSELKRIRINKTTDFSGMGLAAGLVVGGTLGFLPFNADADFRHSMELKDATKIYDSALKWPTDAARLNFATKLFDQNNMKDKAVSLARESVKVNNRNFDGWSYLYFSDSVSANEKREILDKLKKLDPHNPDLKKLG